MEFEATGLRNLENIKRAFDIGYSRCARLVGSADELFIRNVLAAKAVNDHCKAAYRDHLVCRTLLMDCKHDRWARFDIGEYMPDIIRSTLEEHWELKEKAKDMGMGPIDGVRLHKPDGAIVEMAFCISDAQLFYDALEEEMPGVAWRENRHYFIQALFMARQKGLILRGRDRDLDRVLDKEIKKLVQGMSNLDDATGLEGPEGGWNNSPDQGPQP